MIAPLALHPPLEGKGSAPMSSIAQRMPFETFRPGGPTWDNPGKSDVILGRNLQKREPQ